MLLCAIGIDLISYGLGATDKFQGTGVYSGIKMEREKKEEKDDSTKKDDKSIGTVVAEKPKASSSSVSKK